MSTCREGKLTWQKYAKRKKRTVTNSTKEEQNRDGLHIMGGKSDEEKEYLKEKQRQKQKNIDYFIDDIFLKIPRLRNLGNDGPDGKIFINVYCDDDDDDYDDEILVFRFLDYLMYEIVAYTPYSIFKKEESSVYVNFSSYGFNLILHASRDGFEKDVFWNLCDHKTNVVKDTDDIISG
ncbi:hypothetical protein Glove_641g13 [Diversispora epigaea]|uniref:Uncharacterized protein n=1 Tax=Diversispora epigaea TaxID=1348612 RepID=A0A397GCZ4_9GLOM|nr:hypothetical protein Glove_641g13 [Diversispora epigaea]